MPAASNAGTVISPPPPGIQRSEQPFEVAERHSLWLSMLLGLVTIVVATLAAWVHGDNVLIQD